MNHSEYMDRAYEEYFESLAEGEEVLSFAEFSEALSSSPKSKDEADENYRSWQQRISGIRRVPQPGRHVHRYDIYQKQNL